MSKLRSGDLGIGSRICSQGIRRSVAVVMLVGTLSACAPASELEAPESSEVPQSSAQATVQPVPGVNLESRLQEPYDSVLLSFEGDEAITLNEDLLFSELPDVTEGSFAAYAICPPGVTVKVNYLDEAGEIESEWQPDCDGILIRNRIAFDLTDHQMKSIELVVEGQGPWGVVITDVIPGW